MGASARDSSPRHSEVNWRAHQTVERRARHNAVAARPEDPERRAMAKPTPFRVLSFIGCALALALLVGCFETKQEFTLNPDGSGEVVHECTFQPASVVLTRKVDAEAQMKAAVSELLSRAKGVEAWSDVSYQLLEDGRVHFKGTAYFRSLSDLDIPNQTMLDFAWSHAKDGTGTLTLRDKNEQKKSHPEKPEKPSSPEDIKQGRAKFQQAKPMLAMFMASMQHDVLFHLPGKPGKTSAFQRDASGALTLHVDGGKMLQAMDTLISDDKWMARHPKVMDPDTPPPPDAEMNRLLFGVEGPVQATVTGLGAPTFNYDGELEAARESYTALREQLAVKAAAVGPAAQTGELKSIRVVGVRIVREVDDKLGERPFGNEAGYALSLLAELPGSAVAMTDDCGLDTAVADDGTDLMPQSEWNRGIHLPHLTEDKAHTLFEVTLALPGTGVKGLREISGHLQFKAGSATKEIDLGFTKLASGAEGKELGAAIESIDAGSDASQPSRVELQIGCEPALLKNLYLVSGKTRTALRRSGYSGSQETYPYTFESESGISASAKLVAEIYSDLQTFNSTFKLENLTLLGEPKE
jgi:hypothetical protein